MHPPPESGTGGAQPQAGTGAEPQAGTAAGGQEPPEGNGQAPSPGEQQQGGSSSETPEERAVRLEAENRELRRENAERRKKQQERDAAEEQARQAGLTEAQRSAERQAQLEAENQRLQAQVRETALSSTVVAAATRLNFRNPELAVRLLDRSEIEWSESGQPKGIDALLRKLLEGDPYLAKGTAGDYGGGNRGTPPAGKPGMNELLHAALKQG